MGEPRSLRSRLVAWLDRRFYPGVGDNWDDRALATVVERLVRADSRILDVGAGAGIIPFLNFRGRAREVVGIDLDPRVRRNPHLDRAHVGSADEIPEPDCSFDLAFADNVLEHLTSPDAVFREVARLLRPGGYFVVKTPNRFHYVAIAARLTPLAVHRLYNRRRGRADDDTFPTQYRANSRGALERLARRSGLSLVGIDHLESRPEYLRLDPLLYGLGIAWERTVNAVERLAALRVVLLAVFRKEDAPAPPQGVGRKPGG